MFDNMNRCIPFLSEEYCSVNSVCSLWCFWYSCLFFFLFMEHAWNPVYIFSVVSGSKDFSDFHSYPFIMGGNRPLLKHKLVCLLCWRPYRFVHELRAHFDSHHAAWKKHHTDNLTHLNKTCIVCGKFLFHSSLMIFLILYWPFCIVTNLGHFCCRQILERCWTGLHRGHGPHAGMPGYSSSGQKARFGIKTVLSSFLSPALFWSPWCVHSKVHFEIFASIFCIGLSVKL